MAIELSQQAILSLYQFYDKWWNDTGLYENGDPNYTSITSTDAEELTELAEKVEEYEFEIKSELGL